MATATFNVTRDAEDGLWYVTTDEGDYLDWADTEAEALELAKQFREDVEEEAACERLADLADEVQTMVADCEDFDLLNRIKGMLAAGN